LTVAPKPDSAFTVQVAVAADPPVPQLPDQAKVNGCVPSVVVAVSVTVQACDGDGGWHVDDPLMLTVGATGVLVAVAPGAWVGAGVGVAWGDDGAFVGVDPPVVGVAVATTVAVGVGKGDNVITVVPEPPQNVPSAARNATVITDPTLHMSMLLALAVLISKRSVAPHPPGVATSLCTG
jgi:hypothetical protein